MLQGVDDYVNEDYSHFLRRLHYESMSHFDVSKHSPNLYLFTEKKSAFKSYSRINFKEKSKTKTKFSFKNDFMSW